jgi:hypothetical protein
MSEAVIRAAIKTAVEGVSNVGKVHDYERWASEWPAFLELFKTTIAGAPQIRGWEIGYRGFTAIRDPQFARAVLRQHLFEIHGYLGLDDSAATEKTFAALAEDVADALDASATLHGSAYRDCTPAAIERAETRAFGGVLCHFAQLTIAVTEETS